MNHDEAIIETQLAALMRLVASVFALVGLVPGRAAVSVMSVDVRRQVLRVLQPAESALRRVIFYRARGLVVAIGGKRAALTGSIPKGKGDRIPPFALFDPRKWFRELAKSRRPLRGPGPRISGFDEYRPAFDAPAASSNEINPASICRRLQALHKALDDIPAQVKRLARLRARRMAAGEPPRRTEPMRPGFPPGYRKHQTHDVDAILYEFEVLARRDPRPPDRNSSAKI